MSHPDPTSRPSLWLHVMSCIADERRTVPLRSGLSIGRDPRNAIVIDHPDAHPIHATIWETADGLLLDCAEGATAVLADRTEAQRLNLVEGVRCRIGDVLLTCVEITGDIDPDSAADIGHCLRCALYLHSLPETRRFCPRCGLSLTTRASNETTHGQPTPVLFAEIQPDHAPIIAGYATAMNKLGVRYEAGKGVPRNEDEALRCYGKAARLGNDDARTRLEHRDPSNEPTTTPE